MSIALITILLGTGTLLLLVLTLRPGPSLRDRMALAVGIGLVAAAVILLPRMDLVPDGSEAAIAAVAVVAFGAAVVGAGRRVGA